MKIIENIMLCECKIAMNAIYSSLFILSYITCYFVCAISASVMHVPSVDYLASFVRFQMTDTADSSIKSPLAEVVCQE